MPLFRVPTLMKSYIENQTEVLISGTTIAEAINDLVTRYPLIKTQILDKNGDLRRYVNFFINDANIKDMKGMETQIQETDKIVLLPSISGG